MNVEQEKEQLRRVDLSRSPYPFLDNGASELEPDKLQHSRRAQVEAGASCHSRLTLTPTGTRPAVDAMPLVDAALDARSAMSARSYSGWPVLGSIKP